MTDAQDLIGSVMKLGSIVIIAMLVVGYAEASPKLTCEMAEKRIQASPVQGSWEDKCAVDLKIAVECQMVSNDCDE